MNIKSSNKNNRKKSIDAAPGSSSDQAVSLFHYLFLSVIWGIATYYFATRFAMHQFWMVVIALSLFMIPICLNGAYSSVISKIRRLTFFNKNGWIYRLVSGRILKFMLWFVWAAVSSLFMLVQFYDYGPQEWIVFFIIIPVFWMVYKVIIRMVRKELKPYLVTNLSLTWSRRLTPILMLLIYVPLMVSLIEIPEYASLYEAIESRQDKVENLVGSAMVREAAQYMALFEGAKMYALGRIGSLDTILALSLLLVGLWVVFYNSCAILSCFLIPKNEYRRLFMPLTDIDIPPPMTSTRIAISAALISFLLLFIYLPLTVYSEMWIEQSGVSREREMTQDWFISKVEKLDDSYYQPGTMAELQHARIEALHRIEADFGHMPVKIDAMFDQMEVNADTFLNWYYSLVGEYTRIAKLLVGDLETYLLEKLEELLQRGDVFEQFDTALNRLLDIHEDALKEYQATAQTILSRNRVTDVKPIIHVTQSMSLKDILKLPQHNDMINLQTRLASGSAGGAIAGVVTAKIISKLMAKNMLKLAAKGLGKVALSKTAGTAGGAAAGAAAGAAVGSVVPGIGTVIGAAVGGTIGGISVGLTVDKMILMLEEMVSRDQFKGELLQTINEIRASFMKEIMGGSYDNVISNVNGRTISMEEDMNSTNVLIRRNYSPTRYVRV